MAPLRTSEGLFYQVGVSAEEALDLLDEHLSNLKQLARFIVAHVASRVLDEESVLTNRAFVEGIRLNQFSFDPEAFRAVWNRVSSQAEQYKWDFDPHLLRPFRSEAVEKEPGRLSQAQSRMTHSMRA